MTSRRGVSCAEQAGRQRDQEGETAGEITCCNNSLTMAHECRPYVSWDHPANAVTSVSATAQSVRKGSQLEASLNSGGIGGALPHPRLRERVGVRGILQARDRLDQSYETNR